MKKNEWRRKNKKPHAAPPPYLSLVKQRDRGYMGPGRTIYKGPGFDPSTDVGVIVND